MIVFNEQIGAGNNWVGETADTENQIGHHHHHHHDVRLPRRVALINFNHWGGHLGVCYGSKMVVFRFQRRINFNHSHVSEIDAMN